MNEWEMARAGKPALHLSHDELALLFAAVNQWQGQEQIRQQLKQRSRTTVNRAYNVVEAFERRGLTKLDDAVGREVAAEAKYGTTLNYVQRLFGTWRNWKAALMEPSKIASASLGMNPVGDWLRDRHLRRLCALVDDIRSCTFDARRTLFVNQGWLRLPDGSDWGLLPQEWVRAATPDCLGEGFNEGMAIEVWGDSYQLLMQHLTSSPLWQHLKDLRQLAEALDRDQCEVAPKVLAQLDQEVEAAFHRHMAGEWPLDWQEQPGFYDWAFVRMDQTREPFTDAWQELQFRRQRELEQISRTLGSMSLLTVEPGQIPHRVEADWDALPVPYDPDFFDAVSTALKDPIPDLDDRRRALLHKLYEINDALMASEVERLLAGSMCDQCDDTVHTNAPPAPALG